MTIDRNAARARVHRRRSVAFGLLTASLLTASVCAFFLVLGVEIIGFPGDFGMDCGTILDPVDYGGSGQSLCAGTLGEQTVIAAIAGFVALGTLVSGVVILARTPRMLSF